MFLQQVELLLYVILFILPKILFKKLPKSSIISSETNSNKLLN